MVSRALEVDGRETHVMAVEGVGWAAGRARYDEWVRSHGRGT